MTGKHDGGPAFPRFEAPVHGSYPIPVGGMSLRDWFAGQALAGWMASFIADEAVKADGCAQLAYQLADAMLAARSEAGK